MPFHVLGEFLFSNDIIFLLFGIGIPYYNRIYISDLHATCFLLECLFLVCGLTLLYLTGITDDLIGVRYRPKFVITILCRLFFSIAELWINDLYGLLGIYAIPNWIGIPFTILTIVFITNAY